MSKPSNPTTLIFAVAATFAALLGCKQASEAEKEASPNTGAAPAEAPAAAPAGKKAKTQLTKAQLDEVYKTSIQGNFDFKKHTQVATEKLGPPQKVDGDQSVWYGVAPAEGPMPESCVELYTSETKGSGTQATDDENCFG